METSCFKEKLLGNSSNKSMQLVLNCTFEQVMKGMSVLRSLKMGVDLCIITEICIYTSRVIETGEVTRFYVLFRSPFQDTPIEGIALHAPRKKTGL